ncbi:MAG: FtsL-like putative cell division protein [Bacteroidota bacterium]
MANNTFKINPQKKESLFSKLERTLNLGNLFENGLPIKYLPNIGFVTMLIIIYIGYNHNAEKTNREINKLEREVENLRADYTTLKSDYMYSRLQSEVAKRVADMGLVESKVPPQKIVIEEIEH